MRRIGALFAQERVEYRSAGLSIFSTRTPIALLSFDPKLYSRANWVGLNPFTFVSGIDVRCESGTNGVTKISVHIHQFRTVVWVLFWASCSGLAASAMPLPGGVILFVGVTLAAWFGLRFLGGSLIRNEIRDCLKATGTA